MKRIAIVRFILVVSFSMLSLVVKAQHQGHMVLNDERMRPVQVLSTSGTKEWEVSYRPFGEVVVVQDTLNLGEKFGFAGQWYDAESGFYYNYYRDYDPSLGRYIQSDPIGIIGGKNLYVYSEQNPINNYDPFGLKTNCRVVNKKVVCDLEEHESKMTCKQLVESEYRQCKKSAVMFSAGCAFSSAVLLRGSKAAGSLAGGVCAVGMNDFRDVCDIVKERSIKECEEAEKEKKDCE